MLLNKFTQKVENDEFWIKICEISMSSKLRRNIDDPFGVE